MINSTENGPKMPNSKILAYFSFIINAFFSQNANLHDSFMSQSRKGAKRHQISEISHTWYFEGIHNI